MTFEKLQKIMTENNIPSDVRLTSDSGWECGPSEMDGIYYNESENKIVITQAGDEFDEYYHAKNWKRLHGLDMEEK